MTWLKVDDNFPDHPKVKALRADRRAALGLWLEMGCYASRFLTDGFIPDAALARSDRRLADRLVDVDLWERVDGGYRLHDYHDYNPSREKVHTERAAARDRMKRIRSPHVRPNDGRTAPAGGGTRSPELREQPFATPVPSRTSLSSTESESTAREPVLGPIEAALSLLLRRSPKPRELEVAEEMAEELPDGIALATIENLIDERPERNVYGVLIDQLRDAKAAMPRAARNGRIGPKRNPLNDYDALAESGS